MKVNYVKDVEKNIEINAGYIWLSAKIIEKNNKHGLINKINIVT